VASPLLTEVAAHSTGHPQKAAGGTPLRHGEIDLNMQILGNQVARVDWGAVLGEVHRMAAFFKRRTGRRWEVVPVPSSVQLRRPE
jgi:hypothetical protein